LGLGYVCVGHDKRLLLLNLRVAFTLLHTVKSGYSVKVGDRDLLFLDHVGPHRALKGLNKSVQTSCFVASEKRLLLIGLFGHLRVAQVVMHEF
jgi:hypothetical protein